MNGFKQWVIAAERRRRQSRIGSVRSSLASSRAGGLAAESLRLESLEPRTMLAFEPTAAETLLTYLVNETRRAPEATATRLSVNLPVGQRGPFAPLVVNESLLKAARLHSDDMLANNYMSHYGLNGSSPGQRATAAGYATGSISENVYSSSSTGPFADTPEAFVIGMNDGWFQSSGHRENMLTASWTEFGGGVAIRLKPSGATRGTELFGNYDEGPFLTGVVFSDVNSNRRFNVHEGLAGITVTATGPMGTFTTTTMSAGGWSLKVPAGEYVVAAAGGVFAGASSVPVVVGNANVAIDFISGVPNGWVNFAQHVNAAPVLSTALSPTLPPLVVASPSPAGVPVDSLLASAFSDRDTLSPRGIAITSVAGNMGWGWQYSTDAGLTWANIGQPTVATSRLLRSHDLVRLIPTGSQTGVASLSYRAWDQTSGSVAAVVDTTAAGGTSAFSTAIATATCGVIASNTAPTLASSGGGSIASVHEDSASPPGTSVAKIVGAAFSDIDSGTPPAIAVTGTSGASDGTWSYSTNGGLSWSRFDDVSDVQAIPLRSSDLVRFTPISNFVGQATITFRAWDQSSGRAGVAADLTSGEAVGGARPFSVGKATAVVTVTNVNDAPEFVTGAAALRLRPVAANVSLQEAVGTGTMVGDLLGNSVRDRDAAAAKGIAIIGIDGSGDIWWNGGSGGYSTSPPSPRFAMLLRDDDFIYFHPKSGFSGTANVTFRLWDQTADVRGNSGADLSNAGRSTGGTNAFGSEILTAKVVVGGEGASPVAAFGQLTRSAAGGAVESVPVTFTKAVEGFDIGDVSLTRDGTKVALASAILTGTGSSFQIGNLSGATALPGAYVLTLSKVRSGVTDASGNRLEATVNSSFVVALPQQPATPPSAPTSVVGTPGNGSVQLSWAAPASNGGSAITNYVVQRSSDGGLSWTAVERVASSTPSATVTGLTNGIGYVFRVAASNAVGTGAFSVPSASVVPIGDPTLPVAPTSVVASAGNRTVRLFWSPSVGTSTLSRATSYTVGYSRDGGASWTTLRVSSTRPTALVSGLFNGVAYIFRVAGANRFGTGAFSSISSPVTPATSPSAPPKPAVVSGSRQLAVSIAPPHNDGGSRVTRYLVQYRDINMRAWKSVVLDSPSAATFTITGLRDGARYWVRARAENAIGASVFSAPVLSRTLLSAGAFSR